MDFTKFFKLLFRHRFSLIIIPAITVIISYFLVRNLPDNYQSQAQIATGIVDETQKVLNSDDRAVQESQINQEFSNLIEMMKMNKMIDQVSYRLIIHDLTSPHPFKEWSKLMKTLNESAKQNAIKVFKEKYKKKEGLSLWNKEQNGMYALLRSMGYDEESLKQKLFIYRANNSDFIYIEYTSQNPELSAYVVNTLCAEFITYYTSIVKENQQKAVNFLDALLKEKYRAMNQKISLLRDYKIKNRVLNLYEQSKLLYGMILEYETRRQEAEKNIVSHEGAIQGIDSKFDIKDRRYVESTLTRVNEDILSKKQKLRLLQEKYIQNNFDPRFKKSIDSLKETLTADINKLTDKYIYSPLSAKQDLVQQKLSLQIQQDIARYSVKTIETELRELNVAFDKLVPHEAVVQSYERDIEVASKEYLEILNKYNQTHMESGYSIKLRQIQIAMPGLALPSKKMLLVILSGIISFVFCAVVLFILFFLDDSITQPKELAQKTGLTVIGQLKKLQGSKLDLSKVWRGNSNNKDIEELKDQLRSIRFEIDRDLSKSLKTVGITSIRAGEGKTLLSINLAFAYSMMNKKVLLIDGNFCNPSISKTVQPSIYIEDLFKDSSNQSQFDRDNLIQVLGNHGGDVSLLEINKEEEIREVFESLKTLFDIIIIETAPLEQISKSKEWFLFTDKVVSVLEANQTIRESKKQYIEYLKSLDKKLIGWILNKVQNELNKSKNVKS
ncbi:exopolysaccharide transport family protein [Rubrolithibacter danxiaensis]|uniref:exopolysaccharide transport family protein n=1 Tax=Rubrolithibacter danxiaensis TaxID=3390805 RepID=UPI003BF8D301